MKRSMRLIALALPCLLLSTSAIAQSFEEVPIIEPVEWEELIIDVSSRTLDPSLANVRLDEIELQRSRRDVSVSRAEIEASRYGIDPATLDLDPSQELDPGDRSRELDTGGRIAARGALGVRSELRPGRSYDRLSRIRKAQIEKPEPRVVNGAYVVDAP